MDCKGLIFDMDGTLIDSMRYWRQIGTLCMEYCGKKSPGVTLDRAIFGIPKEQVVEKFKDYGLYFSSAQEYYDVHYEAIRPYYMKDVQPLPGLRDFLRNMKEKGIHMCVATATRTDVSIPVLEHLGLLEWFDFVICCDDVGVGKAEPDIYLEAAAKMGCRKEETVVFEDALYCVQTAKKAGFYTIGVEDPTADQAERDQIRKLCNYFIQNYCGLSEQFFEIIGEN